MIETLAIKLLRQALPVLLCCLEQAQSAHYVGMGKSEGILDAAVHMALCSQMDDTIHLLILHQLEHALKITDIHLDKPIVRLVLNILEVIQITRISKLIQIDNLIVRILVYKQAHHMASYKARTTGNYDTSFHISLFVQYLILGAIALILRHNLLHNAHHLHIIK